MPNSPENSAAIAREITKPPPEPERPNLTRLAEVLGVPDPTSFTVEELIEAAGQARTDQATLAKMYEPHPVGSCPLGRGVRNILDLPHDGKVKPVLDAVAALHEGMVRVREALRLPEGASTDHVVDVLDSLWQESAEVRHVLSMPVDRFTAQEVSRRVEDLFGEANRIRDRLGRHPSITVAEVVNEIEFLQKQVEVRNEGLDRLANALSEPPGTHADRLLMKIADLQKFRTAVRSALGGGVDEPTVALGIRIETLIAERRAVRELLDLPEVTAGTEMLPALRAVIAVAQVARSLGPAERAVRDYLHLDADASTETIIRTLVERIRGALGLPPGTLYDSVLERLTKRLKEPQLVQDRPPTPHLNALRTLLSTDEDASADWVLEVLLDRLRGRLGIGNTHVGPIAHAWREIFAGIEAATEPQREITHMVGPEESQLRDYLRTGPELSVDRVIGTLVQRLALWLGVPSALGTREVLNTLSNGLRSLKKPAEVAPVTLSSEAMEGLTARLEEVLQKPVGRVEVVPKLPEPKFSHSPESRLLYRVTMDSSGRRPFSLEDLRSGVYLDRKITREQLLTRVCALVHPSEWDFVSRELNSAFDEGKTSVHIRTELRNDLQGLMFPQVGSPKAQVTLELTSASEHEEDSPLVAAARQPTPLCTLWMVQGVLTQYVSPERTLGREALRFEVMTGADPNKVLLRDLRPGVNLQMWEGTLTRAAERLLDEPGDFAILLPQDVMQPFLAAAQDARARRASKDPVVSGGTRFTPLYVTPRKRTISREYPGTGPRGTTWKVEAEGDGTYYRVTELQLTESREFFRFSGLSFVIEHLFSVPVFDPNQHYGVAVQSNIVDGLLNTLADLEGGRA